MNDRTRHERQGTYQSGVPAAPPPSDGMVITAGDSTTSAARLRRTQAVRRPHMPGGRLRDDRQCVRK